MQSEGAKEVTFTIPPPTPNNPATRPANVNNIQAPLQTKAVLEMPPLANSHGGHYLTCRTARLLSLHLLVGKLGHAWAVHCPE